MSNLHYLKGAVRHSTLFQGNDVVIGARQMELLTLLAYLEKKGMKKTVNEETERILHAEYIEKACDAAEVQRRMRKSF